MRARAPVPIYRVATSPKKISLVNAITWGISALGMQAEYVYK